MTASSDPTKPGAQSGDEHRGLLDEGPDQARVELSGEIADQHWTRPPLAQLVPGLNKFGAAVATFALLVLSSYAVPGLQELQPWRADEDYVPFWNLIGREFMGQGAAQAEESKRIDELESEARKDIELAQSGARRHGAVTPEIPPYVAGQDEPAPAKVPIEFAKALDSFFLSLTQTDLGVGNKMTRISHWGDSVLGNDGITGAIRFAMQKRFGDGGHGFHAISQYDPSYRHKGIRFQELKPWNRCYVIQKRPCGADRRWGFGGSYAFSSKGGASEFKTAPAGRWGQSFSSFELWYAGMPEGGGIDVKIDEAPAVRLKSEAGALEDRWQRFTMQPGEHRVRVSASKGESVRLYGAVMENDGPGVVWDGMALIGSFTSRMRKQNPGHIQAQIAHRNPDLLVLMFGGNDMLRERSDLATSMRPYERDLGALVDHLRGAQPDRACLIMSPIDHGERRGGRIVTRAVVPRMVAAQRRVAKAKGCAFFDTYAAMGGKGSIGRWFNRKPKLASGDLSHATWHGHKVIGRSLFFRALMDAYRNYRGRVAGQPWPEGVALGLDDQEEDVIILDDEDS